jgi:hypothetical protein
MKSETLEIDLNPQFASLLEYYGVRTSIAEGFISTDLADHVKFRARTIYEDENPVSSLLHVNCVTDKGEDLYDLCRDSGETIEEAVSANFKNFASTLNPLLAALGSLNPYSYKNISIEDWQINGKTWEAFIGKPYVKTTALIQPGRYSLVVCDPPSEFIGSMKSLIHDLPLQNRLHWFRGYYCQSADQITVKEFLSDNHPVEGLGDFFGSLPIIPNMEFFSCRAFIVLKEKTF